MVSGLDPHLLASSALGMPIVFRFCSIIFRFAFMDENYTLKTYNVNFYFQIEKNSLTNKIKGVFYPRNKEAAQPQG